MTLAKRSMDVVGSFGGLLVLAPLLLLIWMAVRIVDGAPALFGQERIGRGRKPFRMWKFRTMRVDADHGSRLTVGPDVRVTRLGRLLRKAKLDELPQLWNVLLGEMSLVGPRPEVSEYTEHYLAQQNAVLDLTPGITDPASLAYRNEAALLAAAADPERFYIDQIMPAKIVTNLEYAASATLWSDFVVILRTLHVLPPGPEARNR